MRTNSCIWLILAGLATAMSCGEPAPPKEITSIEPQEIIVVLDLSDRILENGQIEKDIAIIESILTIFEQNQKKQAFITSKDVLQVVIAKEPGVDIIANDQLRIDMNKKTDPQMASTPGLALFKARKSAFRSSLEELYRQAQKKPNPGADIYSFFCTELPIKYMQEKTKVIVLTDGYLLFDSPYLKGRPRGSYMRELESLRNKQADWKAYFEKRRLELTPCDRELDNVEVLMLETAPKNQGASVYEFDFIEHYWLTWFEAMGVQANIYPHEQKTGVIEDKVRAFLGKN